MFFIGIAAPAFGAFAIIMWRASGALAMAREKSPGELRDERLRGAAERKTARYVTFVACPSGELTSFDSRSVSTWKQKIRVKKRQKLYAKKTSLPHQKPAALCL
jgi:hypothetical protein